MLEKMKTKQNLLRDKQNTVPDSVDESKESADNTKDGNISDASSNSTVDGI